MTALAVERASGEVSEAAHGGAVGQARGLGHRDIVGDGPAKRPLRPQRDLDPWPARTDLATIRATSSTAPAEASMFERLSLAASCWLPQNTYSDRKQ
jgi:hypothetical protein